MTTFSIIVFSVAICGFLGIKITELVFRAKGHPNFQKKGRPIPVAKVAGKEVAVEMPDSEKGDKV